MPPEQRTARAKKAAQPRWGNPAKATRKKAYPHAARWANGRAQRDTALLGRSGAWPDGDMLPLGRIGIVAERGTDRRSRFTPAEQRTVMSLWSIAQSPLIFGGDLPSNDEPTTSLITNDEVLAVNQKGSHGRELFSSGPQRVWAADSPDSGARYLGVFNLGERDQDIRIQWPELGLPQACVLRDLWDRKDLGEIRGGHTFRVAPHASGLY